MNNELKKTPFVSVIMPTYNNAPFIAEAIESVLAQTYRNLELVIVDNHSADATEDIVRSFSDERIRYFQYNNNGVIASSRNYGANNSSGTVLAFIDSDDIWVPNKLEDQLIHLKDGIRCVASDLIPIGDIRHYRRHITFKRSENYKDLSYRDIALMNQIPTSSTIVWKDDFAKLGGFDESPDFRCIEDWELWLRIAAIGKIRVLSKPLIRYRIIMKAGRDYVDICKRSIRIFEKHARLGYLDNDQFKGLMGNNNVRIGKAYLNANDRAGMRYYYYGFINAHGIHNRIKAIAGIMLLCMPRIFRKYILAIFYGK